MRACNLFHSLPTLFAALSWTALLAIGCQQARASGASSVAAPAPAAQAAQPLKPLALSKLPTPAKYGLVVCDPVTASPALAQFAEWCGRWLDLIAAGQPELGQTAFWSDRFRVEREMKKTSLQLAPAQGAELRTITGANVGAFGAISGTAKACALTYRLQPPPSGAAIGPILKAERTEAQILAALPGIAKKIDALLEVTSPRIPKSVGLTPAQLTRMLAIANEKEPTQSDLSTLSKLADLSPLEGMYYRQTDVMYDFVKRRHLVDTILTQQPENALVISLIDGYEKPEVQDAHVRKAIAALAQRYLSSALLVHAARRSGFNIAGEYVNANEWMSHCAPNDLSALVIKAEDIEELADYLRQGRTADKIKESEWTELNSDYAKKEDGAKMAAALDPKYGGAQLELAEAATFAGDPDTAKRAISKALALGQGKESTYWWAIQMYQPKWYEDDDQLARSIKLAIAEP